MLRAAEAARARAAIARQLQRQRERLARASQPPSNLQIGRDEDDVVARAVLPPCSCDRTLSEYRPGVWRAHAAPCLLTELSPAPRLELPRTALCEGCGTRIGGRFSFCRPCRLRWAASQDAA